MLIYAVSDLHAKPERFEIIQSNIESYHPDVLVVAGDIINYLQPAPILKMLNNMRIPVLAVRGNSDPKYVVKYFNAYPNITLLNASCTTVNGIKFTGLSGTIPVPFRSRVGFFEKRLMKKVIQLIDTETVLIAHPPPYGTLDRVGKKVHAGSSLICNLIAQTNPRLLICGHIHEDAGIEKLGQTVVVNCCVTHRGQGVLIDWSGEGDPKPEMLVDFAENTAF